MIRTSPTAPSTTDLFAAVNIATGEVLYDTKRSHKATDGLAFFKLIDLHVTADLEIYVVLDNLSPHKAPPVAKWLADPKRARWHLHFTSTSSSWLNLIGRWFNELTERRLRRGAFTSVHRLIEAIEIWAEYWNDDPKPFIWHKPIEEIVTKGASRADRPYPSHIRDAPLGGFSAWRRQGCPSTGTSCRATIVTRQQNCGGFLRMANPYPSALPERGLVEMPFFIS